MGRKLTAFYVALISAAKSTWLLRFQATISDQLRRDVTRASALMPDHIGFTINVCAQSEDGGLSKGGKHL